MAALFWFIIGVYSYILIKVKSTFVMNLLAKVLGQGLVGFLFNLRKIKTLHGTFLIDPQQIEEEKPGKYIRLIGGDVYTLDESDYGE